MCERIDDTAGDDTGRQCCDLQRRVLGTLRMEARLPWSTITTQFPAPTGDINANCHAVAERVAPSVLKVGKRGLVEIRRLGEEDWPRRKATEADGDDVTTVP